MLAGEQYHVFNHANGRENLFLEEKNYVFFLEKLEQYILPVCKMYAYCLLPNHFHLVMEVRSENYLNALWNSNPGMSLPQDKLQYKTSKAFANFFSSYTQSFNKVYNRKGSLFIPSM